MPLHVSSTSAHRQEAKIVLYSLWYHHTCRWPSGAQVEINILRCTVSKISKVHNNSFCEARRLCTTTTNIRRPIQHRAIFKHLGVSHYILEGLGSIPNSCKDSLFSITSTANPRGPSAKLTTFYVLNRFWVE